MQDELQEFIVGAEYVLSTGKVHTVPAKDYKILFEAFKKVITQRDGHIEALVDNNYIDIEKAEELKFADNYELVDLLR